MDNNMIFLIVFLIIISVGMIFIQVINLLLDISKEPLEYPLCENGLYKYKDAENKEQCCKNKPSYWNIFSRAYTKC